jgi:hypothetical protein
LGGRGDGAAAGAGAGAGARHQDDSASPSAPADDFGPAPTGPDISDEDIPF